MANHYDEDSNINSAIAEQEKRFPKNTAKGNPLILKLREEIIPAMRLYELRVACIPMMAGNTIQGYEVRTVHVKADSVEQAYDVAIAHGYTPIS